MSKQVISGDGIGLQSSKVTQDEMFGRLDNPRDVVFYVKVTPGTPLYDMVLDVNKSIPDISRQKCIRLLARAGYNAFRNRTKDLGGK